MTLGALILLSFLHVAVCVASPFTFFMAAFIQRRFELSKSDTDICFALWGAYSILTIASVVLVSYCYLTSSQAAYYWWFAMPWASLAVLIAFVVRVWKVK